MADLFVHGGGTVYLVRPTSPLGVAWVDQHISPDAMCSYRAAEDRASGA